MRAVVARVNVNEFCEYVLRDEVTGKPVVQAPHHELLQKLANEHDRLVVWAFVESGKTFQLSIGRVLWELGRNPNLRVCVVSNAIDQARKIVSTIASYIDTSAELREVFPHLRRGLRWTSTSFTVERHQAIKEPSVQVVPWTTSRVLGSRFDRVILDDVLTWDTAFNAKERERLWNWYNANITGRLTEHARVIAIGNAFHPQDFLHQLSRNPRWKSVRIPITGEDGKSIWPERWPDWRIEQRRNEISESEFARQLMCVSRDEQSARFQRKWIDIALSLGDGKRPCYALQQVPPGYRTYTGVDLGTREKSNSALTVFFTIAVAPDGTREVLWVESGRWHGPDIVSRVIDHHRRYHSVIIIESVSAQQFILDFAKKMSAVPVRPFNTGKNKLHPEFGIEGLATEIANGKWVIPNEGGKMHPEIAAWVNEMLAYDPSLHTGDRLMACYFSREGARQAFATRGAVGHIDLMRR
jgi:hypothetical protein